MFFARNGIEPVRLVYEDIVAKPQMAVDSVAGLFGLAGSAVADVGCVDVRTQRDGMTEEWRQRFIAECGDCDFIDRLQGPAPELRGASDFGDFTSTSLTFPVKRV